ncbi:MAG TPA: hypothetical protein VFS52_23075 [Steroidobacteraceae bacterium]|jgi:hypothetical protein|nr:hypothetical protein [Steroidobacteraceae bacterium]
MRTNFRTALTLILLASLPAFVSAAEPHMEVIAKKDISGQVLKRLGLPNQDYCWEQCLEDARCTGTRWAVIAGTTAGQCQLISGALNVADPHSLKTEDGQKIVVTASRKVSDTARQQ